MKEKHVVTFIRRELSGESDPGDPIESILSLTKLI